MVATADGNGHGRGVVVALVSVKGAPGVTTTAVGLAARWLRPGPLVVEADPAGGDLAARFGRDVERGIAAVALDSRDPDGNVEPRRWAHDLPFGVAALLAPPGVQASASLTVLKDHAQRLLATLTGQFPAVLVDAGRWSPGSPAEPLITAADVLLVVARPTLDQISQVEAHTEALRTLAGNVRLVLVGEGPWPADEVAARLRLPAAVTLPVDRNGAGVLSGQSVPRRGWRSTGWTRLPLLRACRALAGQVYGSAAPLAITPAANTAVPAAPPQMTTPQVVRP